MTIDLDTRETVLEKAYRLADALRDRPMTWAEQCEMLGMSRASCQRVRRVMRDQVLEGTALVLSFDADGRHYLTDDWTGADGGVESQVLLQLPGVSTQLNHLLHLVVSTAGSVDGRTARGRRLRELAQRMTEAALAVEAAADDVEELCAGR